MYYWTYRSCSIFVSLSFATCVMKNKFLRRPSLSNVLSSFWRFPWQEGGRVITSPVFICVRVFIIYAHIRMTKNKTSGMDTLCLQRRGDLFEIDWNNVITRLTPFNRVEDYILNTIGGAPTKRIIIIYRTRRLSKTPFAPDRFSVIYYNERERILIDIELNVKKTRIII